MTEHDYPQAPLTQPGERPADSDIERPGDERPERPADPQPSPGPDDDGEDDESQP
jgi:hypothetical protein